MSNVKRGQGGHGKDLRYSHQRTDAQVFFFFASRRRHTRFDCDWSSDVCSSDLAFATMNTEEGAKAAIAALNGKDWKGRALTVNEARPREEKGGRGGGGYGGGRDKKGRGAGRGKGVKSVGGRVVKKKKRGYYVLK